MLLSLTIQGQAEHVTALNAAADPAIKRPGKCSGHIPLLEILLLEILLLEMHWVQAERFADPDELFTSHSISGIAVPHDPPMTLLKLGSLAFC